MGTDPLNGRNLIFGPGSLQSASIPTPSPECPLVTSAADAVILNEDFDSLFVKKKSRPGTTNLECRDPEPRPIRKHCPFH
jgi:hypothetical protein